MKKIFIVLFVLIGFKGISQDLSLGLYGGINVNKINHYDNKNDYLKNNSKSGVNGEIGVNFELLKNKFTYEVGIEYYSLKTNFYLEKINYIEYFYLDTISGEYLVPSYASIPYNKNVFSKSNNINIPLKIGYVFGDKLKIIPKIGINSLLTIRREIACISPNIWYKTEYRDSFNVGILLELELRFKINEKFNVFSGFNYHHNLIPIDGFESKYKAYHNGFDLNVGIRYNLKK